MDEVLGLASGLVNVGLRSGLVVALCALNSDRYLVWLLAITFVGGIAAPLNYRWSSEEAKYAIDLVKPVMLVTDECSDYWYSKFVTKNMPFIEWQVLMNSSEVDSTKRFDLTTEALKRPASNFRFRNYCQAPNGAAIICFTSGTTGKPKGVTISHSALIMQSLAKLATVGYCEDDIYLHTAPLCHIGGISSAMAMLMIGACHIIIPKFDAKSAIKAIEKFHVTSFITVPAMMADILSLIRIEEAWKGNETVKKLLNGGGGLSPELIKDATKFFPKAKIISAYGMTETCSSMTFITLYDPQGENSYHVISHLPGAVCVGKPAPHIEIKIASEGSNRIGSILTRGPHVMLGYWSHVSAKAMSLASDEGWLDTGDIGQMDEYGNLCLVGRLKGRIKSGGENVYPEEVESILSQHPGVHAVAVVGVPDARLTEMVVACVRLRENWRWNESSFDHYSQSKSKTLSGHILQQFCRDKHLTGFKIPKFFIVWKKQFPVTTTGKLRRDEVRNEVASSMRFLTSSL